MQSGPLWRAALLLAAVRLSLDGPKDSAYSYRVAAVTVSSYVTKDGLDDVWLRAPPFDGDQLRQILPKIPNGPPFREVCLGKTLLFFALSQTTTDERALVLIFEKQVM